MEILIIKRTLLLDPYPDRRTQPVSGSKTLLLLWEKKSVRSVNGADLGSDTLKVESLVYLLNFSTSHQAAAQSHIYLEYHSVCLLVWLRTPPPPLPQASVLPSPPPPPNTGGRQPWTNSSMEATHSPVCREWRSPNSDDWRKGLALCLLCAHNPQLFHISCWKHPPSYWHIFVF